MQESAFHAAFIDVKFKPFFLAFGDLLTVLITLDTIVRSNRVVAVAWDKYKRMTDVMRADPVKYGGDVASAAHFDAMLRKLDDGTLVVHHRVSVACQ